MRGNVTSTAGTKNAAAISKALRQEKARFDTKQVQKFAEHRRTESDNESSKSFPRTLANGTFFTPHLAKRTHRNAGQNIAHEYAVLLKVNDLWVLSRPTYSPSLDRSRISQQPLTLGEFPSEVKTKILDLENKGFRFHGRNKNLLIFERIYNQKRRNRYWVSTTAATFGTGVALLTALLFAGEYLF